MKVFIYCIFLIILVKSNAQENSTNLKNDTLMDNSTDFHNSSKENEATKSNKRLSLFYLEKCYSNSECKSMNECVNNECRHKGIDISFKNIFSFVLIFFGISLSSAIGLGGGNIILPLLLIMLNFYIKQAIPLSKSLILISSLTTFLIHLFDNNPLNLFLDYNSSLPIIPGILIGSTIGAILGKMLHGILLVSILSIILFLFAIKSMSKYFTAKNYEESKESDNIPLQEINDNNSYNVSQYYSKKDESLASIQIKDYKYFTLNKISLIILPFTIFVVFNFLLKNIDIMNQYTMCDFNYYYSTFVIIILMCICLIFNGFHLISEFTERKENNYHFNKQDLKWNWLIVIKFFILGIIVGLLSSSVGIGGGVLISPLLLDMGLAPYNTSHVTNFIVLFTSSSTVLQFYFQESLVYENTLILFLITIIASLTGAIFIKLILNKSKKEYLIILILSIALFISAISMILFSILKIYQRQYKNSIFGFAEICKTNQ